MWRFALVVLASLAVPPVVAADEVLSPKSILLVARKDLPDPFFKDSVVLVTNAQVRPIGVIINKPLPLTVAKALPDKEKIKSRDERVFFGGPVAPDEVTFVFRTKLAPDDAIRVVDDVYISGNREVLDRLLARENPMEGLRIFAGHAGWGPGQLENEISRGDWHLAPADLATIFSRKPEGVWMELYGRAAATKVRYTE